MKYNLSFTGLLLLFTYLTAPGQSKEFKYYFDKDFTLTEKAKSIFTGTGTYDGIGIKLELYNASHKNLLSVQHFTDSSLQVKNGLFQSYYSNASLQSESTYLEGKKDGLWKKWNPEGKIIDSSIYQNGKRIIGTIFSYQGGTVQSFTNINENSDGPHTVFSYGEGVNSDGETYQKVDEDKIFTKAEIEPSFPGGEISWIKYITPLLQQNIDTLTKENYTGTCRVKFIVYKDGSVKDVEAVTMKGTVLARIAVTAIRNGPKWIPAIQNKRFVNAYKIQDVIFPIQKPD